MRAARLECQARGAGTVCGSSKRLDSRVTDLAQSELHLAIVYADVSRLVAALLDRTLQELGELISSKDAFGLTPVERAADMVMLCGTPTPVTQPLECLRLVIGAHLMLATTKHAPPPPRARLPQLVLDVAKEEVIPVSQSTAEVEELFHIAFGMPHPANLEDAAAQAMLLLLQGGANAHWRTEQLLGMSASLWARWRTVEDTRGWPEAGFAVAKRLCTPLLQAGAADSGPITRALLSARTIEGVSFASLLFTTPEDAIREVVVAASKRQSHWAEKMPLFWFLDADKLRSLSEEEVSVMRFRTLQELQRDDPSWIVEKRIDWEGAVCGEYEDEYAACSHRCVAARSTRSTPACTHPACVHRCLTHALMVPPCVVCGWTTRALTVASCMLCCCRSQMGDARAS